VLVNILAPAVVEQHFTFGFSVERDNGHELSFAFMYAPEKSVSGPNLFDPTQQIELSMDQYELEFAYSF
jgi:long-chain fatty acid transport protein